MRLLTEIYRRKIAFVSSLLLIVFLVAALFPSLLATHSPTRQDLRARLQPPSLDHFLGTDGHGRDVYSRLVHGARVSLLIGVASVTFAAVIGVALGLTAGYLGGRWDAFVTMLVEWIVAFPMILLAISIVAVLGPGMFNMILAIGLVGIPNFARAVRGEVLKLKNTEFVMAAQASGAGSVRIMVRHILTNSFSVVIVLATMRIATAVLAEATLGYLGLGLAPPTPAWGMMVSDGREYLQHAPWVALVPGIFIMVLVLAFNLFGDGLRDALDPRLKHETARSI